MGKGNKATRQIGLESHSLGHFFEEIANKDGFYLKRFFRGLSIYVFGKAVVYISNRPGDKSFRGKSYRIEIWNGCLIPTDREHHDELLGAIKGTIVHPVIKKWLYLPQKSEYFEDSMNQIVELIKKKSSLIGVEPKLKIKKSRSKKASQE